jgi:predicted site-specific integrase-resolvase
MTTPTEQAPPDWYTASQAADLLGGVTTRTLANWADAGLLNPTRGLAGRGQRRYPGAEVRALATQMGVRTRFSHILKETASAGAA